MKTAIVIFAVLSIPVLAYSATIYVPDHYPTIQGAIDASVNGDTIIVRTGTYVENIDFIGKAISLTSELGADVTIIDGGNPVNPDFGSVVTFSSGEEADSILEGFTLTNGTGTGYGPGIKRGGGIYCNASSPTITCNIIVGNSNLWKLGGGIYCNESFAFIAKNTIIGNLIKGEGGGIYCYCSSPTITKNTISGNIISLWPDESGGGGGICCYASSPTISNNIISGNNIISEISTNKGGGILCSSSNPLITNNLIYNHQISNGSSSSFGIGGGICCEDSSPMITNNTFTQNSANFGGGIYCENSSPIITNTISWNNTAYWQGPGIYGGTPIVTYCDVEGGGPGTGMIDADPLFVDPAINDFHLTFNSPCRDTGDNSAVTEPTDFEGDPRIAWSNKVDMGADEFYNHLYCTGDAIPGHEIDVKIIAQPLNHTMLILGTGFLAQPTPTVYGEWWLVPPLMVFDLGLVPFTGMILLKKRIPHNCPVPFIFPAQGVVENNLTNLYVLEIK